MLQVVGEEFERIMNLKHVTAKIQERDVFQVQGVHQKLKEDREKVYLIALVVVVCISRSVVHSRTKRVSGAKKLDIGRCFAKIKKEN